MTRSDHVCEFVVLVILVILLTIEVVCVSAASFLYVLYFGGDELILRLCHIGVNSGMVCAIVGSLIICIELCAAILNWNSRNPGGY